MPNARRWIYLAVFLAILIFGYPRPEARIVVGLMGLAIVIPNPIKRYVFAR